MNREIGAVAVMRWTFSQEDFDRFAALSGDDNPIHVDPVFAARTRFGRTVCHGMLLYSTICVALSCEIGTGFVQREQKLMFVTPTYAGEEVAVRLEVTALDPERGQVELSTVITRPDGPVACQGQARMALPGRDSDGIGDTEAAAPNGLLRTDSRATSHKGLVLGQAVQVKRVFTAADLAEYVSLAGDTNPAYRGTGNGTPGLQVPNGLLGGLFSCLLGTRLPGRGTNWLKQRLAFPEPASVGDPIEARVEIVRLRPDKDLVNLRTTCTLADGRIVCHGEALVLVKDLGSV